MRCGLFGKLPAKRDFIALFAPRGFLDAWEPWMQSSISASRQQLAERWQHAFLTAPIWRFWLGAEICGRTVLGALMCSLDGLGRYYPLTIFGYADRGAAIPPPELDAQDEWFVAAEDFLLRTLEKDIAFETVTGALDALAAPMQEPSDAVPDDLASLAPGAVAARVEGSDFPAVFSALRAANHESTYAAASAWWTLGGEDFQPLALTCKGMPDPFLFANMLSGRLDPAIEQKGHAEL
jgi:type VI secretion system protein ImpM